MINRFKSNRGQTLIEFSIVLLLLLILFFAILEGTIIIYDKVLITRACRDGARVGSLFRVNADGNTILWTQRQAEIQAEVDNYLQNRLITFGAPYNAITTSNWVGAPPSQGGSDGRVEVNVAFSYTYLTLGRLLNIGGGKLNLSVFTRMRTE
jgi:Flp pilus assembly protein TadG